MDIAYAPFTLQLECPAVTGDPRWKSRLPGRPIFPTVFGHMVILLSCHGSFHILFTVTWIFHKVCHGFQQCSMARHCGPTDI